MTDAEQREAARQFVNRWKKGGDEKQDCHPYWLELLQDVLGVQHATEYIQFEKPVKLPEADGKVHTRYIDGYIPDVKVLIEQKGSVHSLDEKEPQSGGEMLTPYEQGKRYNDNLPFEEKARWIVTSNFTSIWIYDMNETVPEPQKIDLIELQTKYSVLDFLVKKDVKKLSHEMEVSIKAGDIVGLLYDAFLKQYGIPEMPPKDETDEEKAKREHKLRSLNALCVRLVFLFYAEDSDIFERNQFHDYMEQFSVKESRRALLDLFHVLDQKEEDRDDYLEDDLKAFPYVNGGLFSDESIEIPQFNDEIRNLILHHASEDFNWRDISPTIFGAVFESTLNPETRRAGGMHYTSIENIHKVIDPLFLDDLKTEFEEIKKVPNRSSRTNKLKAFQRKIASLKFLDPACGSGNFLTESYLSLRRLENQVIGELAHGQIAMASEEFNNPIQVSIQQFYGIEINDFAVTVAKTALWIAESQMLDETKTILYGFNQDFLPLKTYVNIYEGNALRIDWNNVVDKNSLTYIMGNPPFVGFKFASSDQKDDLKNVFGSLMKPALLDYVCCWYKQAIEFIQGTKIHCAFVSTNSVSQGQMAGDLWSMLLKNYTVYIDFAWRTFVWTSESGNTASVHVVIIGFSATTPKKRYLYDANNKKKVDSNISPYLIEGPNVLVTSRRKPLCNVPPITMGNQAMDGGNLIIEANQYDEFISKEPAAKPFIKRYMMGYEFINNKKRYCLWLVDCTPKQLNNMPLVKARVEAVQQFRASSHDAGARKKAETPMLFREQRNPNHFIAIPIVSSQRRRYIPMGYLGKDTIAGNKLFIIADAQIYHFGVLESNVHMSWMRTVAARLKSDYTYSKDIVYNNFPWPSPTDDQKKKIEQTAQGILNARALYHDSSLADLYDPLTMPSELRKAHIANDRAVMAAYGFSTKMSESDCVAELMKMYEQLVEKTDKNTIMN